MSAIVVSNTTEEDDTVLDVPVKGDGTPYRFEMLFNGLVDRAYADTAEDLLDCMIPQYQTMTVGERFAARLSHAVRTQTTVQADINWHHANLTGCTPAEIAVLTSSRSTPPEIREWSSEVPIVLVDVFYRPLGALPQPISTLADVQDPPNLFWLRVEDEYGYLGSLGSVGFIDLNEHADYHL
jgi:hypothetical protein